MKNRFASPVPALVFLLLAVLLFQALMSMRLKSPTYDEPFHLAAGYLYLTTSDFSYGREHPPLVKVLAGFPLLFMDLRISDNDTELIARSDSGFGKKFLFAPGNDVDRIVFWSRIPVVLLSILLGFYVFLWSRKLFGDRAGLLALTLYVFSPNILAHSRLVTTDLGSTCFIFIACFCFWCYLNKPSLRESCLTGLFLGLALASKYSALVLFPVFLFMLGAKVFAANPGDVPEMFRSGNGVKRSFLSKTFFKHLAVAFSVAVVVIFCAYGLKPNALSLYWDGLEHLRTVHFPEGRHYQNYFMGELSDNLSWYYHLVAFLIKTPVPMLILLVLAAGAFRHPGKSLFDEMCLIIPVVLILILSAFDSAGLGLRRVLPMYPFLFVYASRILSTMEPRRFVLFRKPFLHAGVALLACWYVVSSVRTYPDYLAYFNEIVGGPQMGILYLDDSNIDWGQDLKRLNGFLKERGIEKVKLFYNGEADPKYYGIDCEEITWDDILKGPQPGYYAISAHYLIRVLGLPEWKGVAKTVGVLGHSIHVLKINPTFSQ